MDLVVVLDPPRALEDEGGPPVLRVPHKHRRKEQQGDGEGEIGPRMGEPATLVTARMSTAASVVFTIQARHTDDQREGRASELTYPCKVRGTAESSALRVTASSSADRTFIFS